MSKNKNRGCGGYLLNVLAGLIIISVGFFLADRIERTVDITAEEWIDAK